MLSTRRFVTYRGILHFFLLSPCLVGVVERLRFRAAPICVFLDLSAGDLFGFRDRREIVGVVADIKQNGLEAKEPIPMIYLPHTQYTLGRTFLVARTQVPPEALYSAVRDVFREIDPDTPAHDLRTIEDRNNTNLTSRRFNLGLIFGFAGLALGMAMFGVFSVIAYSVNQRTREIGVRVALGAQRGDVVSMVLGQGIRAAILGVALGLLLSLWATRLIESMLFGVQRYDVVSFGLVALLLLATCLAAC